MICISVTRLGEILTFGLLFGGQVKNLRSPKIVTNWAKFYFNFYYIFSKISSFKTWLTLGIYGFISSLV